MQKLDSAIQWLQEQQGKMVEELIQLCNINSFSDNLAGLLRTADHLEHLMKDLNVECHRHTLPVRESIDDSGNQTSLPAGPALKWSSSSNNKPSVLLAIHYDTVYPTDHPLQSCVRIDDDRLRGPGVIDAKGGIIVLRWAVLAGLKYGLLEGVSWSILLNPDEEVGSPSTSSLWESMATKFDFGMLYEPCMADNSMVDTRKGTGNFQWLIGGKSAHSGRNFDAGRNAIVHSSKLAVALHELNGQKSGVTINVGRVNGGGPLNVVPDLCSLRANVRVENREQQDWIEAQLESLTDRFHEPESGFTCRRIGGLASPPKVLDSATKHWMAKVESAAAQIGQSVGWKGSGGASDGNKLAAFGLPNIDTFGPEGDCLHSPDEWIRLSSLPKKAALSLAVLSTVLTSGGKSTS